MFNFSSKTVVDRKFKLTDLYKQMSASKEAKKDGTMIESIVLKNVLSPTTLYCDADKAIKEIYVFEITVKERYVPETFIKELDKSIKLHTLFNVIHEDYELSMISYKLGTQKGKYWQTNWENEDDHDVPLVNSVPEMYKYILSKFLAYPPFESESVEEYVKRYNMLAKLDFQIGKTTSAIAHETQSKKRFEYNARLKEYKAEREKLLSEVANE
jgi:hypothetical protein